MNPPLTVRTLRILIVAQVAARILAGCLGIMTEDLLPPELRSHGWIRTENTTGSWPLQLWLGPPLLAIYVVASIGLYAAWRPARFMYLVYVLFLILVVPMIGPMVETGLAYAAGLCATTLSGMILGVVYWSPLREQFEKARSTE